MSITSVRRTPMRRRSRDATRTLPPRPSQKINAVALAGAIATMFWTLLAAYVTTKMPKEVIATLTGATTTILAFGLGYLIRD